MTTRMMSRTAAALMVPAVLVTALSTYGVLANLQSSDTSAAPETVQVDDELRTQPGLTAPVGSTAVRQAAGQSAPVTATSAADSTPERKRTAEQADAAPEKKASSAARSADRRQTSHQRTGTSPTPTQTTSMCELPAEVTADKVLLVTGTGGSTATLTACAAVDGGYVADFTFSARVGYKGIAAPGAKREGDGKTPAGVYNLTAGFGVKAKPTEFTGEYTKVTRDHVWVDGDASTAEGYNTMQRTSAGYRGESLYQRPAYDHAQVIDYNSDRTPGMGSAIFLHVHTGSGKTAGCVSVSEAELKKIFAWQGADATQIAIQS